MELKMQPYSAPAQILFNYEELKRELAEKLSTYETMVYSEDQIAAAKKDRAQLNALKKALNDERLRRQREYMQPFDAFKAQVDEIIRLIDKPARLIDSQVKAFEDKQQQMKIEEIKAVFDATGFPEFVTLERIWDKRWLNKTAKLKQIAAALDAERQRIEADLATLAAMPFAFEATEEYRRTLNLNQAVEAGKRAADVARRKAEQEAIRAQMHDVRQVNGAEPIQQAAATPDEAPAFNAVKTWVGFRAYLTVDEALELRRWFESYGIDFKPV